jgi:hypothetical protein
LPVRIRHPSRLNRATLADTYRFGDVNYAREELRAELASVFLAAERGIPHDPASHAAYVGSWIKALREDKNEIFRAAHDASGAADYLLALERDKTRAEALEANADSVEPEQQKGARNGPLNRAPEMPIMPIHSVYEFTCICGRNFQTDDPHDHHCPDCGRAVVIEWRDITQLQSAASSEIPEGQQ